MRSKNNISIFEPLQNARAPLAEQLRPSSWEDFCGFSRIPSALKERLKSPERQLPSIILWGPPGCGKTTFARIVGYKLNCNFIELSAVQSGVSDIREAAERAKLDSKQTIVFLDEIHRLNKGQQDALLPHLEKGVFSLIGATTENPSFTLNKALLSRCTLVTLEPLAEDDLMQLAKKAADKLALKIDEANLKKFAECSNQDGRRLCNLLEMFSANIKTADFKISSEDVEIFLSQNHILSYDRAGEDHYNIISAFIKSMRGSDIDASLYWCFRMLEAGEDPAFVLRRMIIFASEDVGNADPRALPLAISTAEAFERVGFPEGKIPIAQCVVFLASAPKSNRSYMAMKSALAAVKDHPSAPVPIYLRNAPTDLMKSLGYGEDYKYPHDYQGSYATNQSYMPEEIKDRNFYTPSGNGYEKTISERIAYRKSLEEKDVEE